MSRRQPGLFDPTEAERRASLARMDEDQRRRRFATEFRLAGRAVASRALLAWVAPCIVADLDRRRRKLPRTVEYAADLYACAWREYRGDGGPA